VVSSSEVEPDNSTTVTLVTPTLYPIAKGSSFVLSRQSKVLASGHSFEYIGAGPNIQAALPINNGTFIQQQEIEERDGGSVIFTSTDQSGNFRIGDGVIIDQTSGTIGGISFSRGLFAQITPLILALQ
jgi:outer membrane protein assembly factor BamB